MILSYVEHTIISLFKDKNINKGGKWTRTQEIEKENSEMNLDTIQAIIK